MGEFDEVENYLLHGKYPEGYMKGEKANLWRNAETISRLRLESCTTGNVPPEVRNHGRYVQEERMKRRESLGHAMLALQVCKV